MPTAGSAMTSPARVGVLLKHWRSTRRWSQLDLALQADVSARHLSFVETGRSQPSREMVMRLAEALGVPLRERNAMLLAAGFAPAFRESGLEAPDLALARRAVAFILRQLEPHPAVVIDRLYELVQLNDGASRLFGLLLAKPPDSNLLRLVFRPDGLRPVIANWEEVALRMLRRLQRESGGQPADDPGRALLAEVLALPGVPRRWHSEEPRRAPLAPLLTVTFRKAGRSLRFFSTITTFGTALDITLEELRIECFYPADEATDAHCRAAI